MTCINNYEPERRKLLQPAVCSIPRRVEFVQLSSRQVSPVFLLVRGGSNPASLPSERPPGHPGEVPHPLPLLLGLHVFRQPGFALHLSLLARLQEQVHARWVSRCCCLQTNPSHLYHKSEEGFIPLVPLIGNRWALLSEPLSVRARLSLGEHSETLCLEESG